MIVTYSKYYNYQFFQIILMFRNFIYNDIINKQNKLAYINLFICLFFCILNTLECICFYKKTVVLFCKYFYFHLQLRFFNNYLLYKTKLILHYMYNFSNKKNIMKKLNAIEVIDYNNESKHLNSLILDKIDDIKFIRINPFQIKLLTEINLNKNNVNNENNENHENIKKVMEKKISHIINKNKTMNLKFNKQFNNSPDKKRKKIVPSHTNKQNVTFKLNENEYFK